MTGRIGEQTVIPGTTSSFSNYNASFLSVTGYAADGVNDRTAYIDTEYYRQVTNAYDFLKAISDAQTGAVKVIEVMNDINLGYIAAGSDAQTEFSSFFRKDGLNSGYINTNPQISESGVSDIRISGINGLTIFSQNGATLKHTQINLQRAVQDIIIRNLGFDGLWQWDNSGNHKEAGWTYIKVNGSKNVWIDHCSLTIAADGNIDLENGANGVTISWCKFGLPTDQNPDEDSMIYASINYMEELYQTGDSDVNGGNIYSSMRDAGATPNQIMAYAAWHSKVHLSGSGDKDYIDYVYSSGEVLEDSNEHIEIAMAYNWYQNIAQRVPMVRQGQGHMFNCYVDNMAHVELVDTYSALSYGRYSWSRCLNARNGATVAADTSIFDGIREPITGAEIQGDDTSNMSAPWDDLFAETYNHVLIVNSKTTSASGDKHAGSSWDNNGENLFVPDFIWKDKSTIGEENWAWSFTITGIKNTEFTREDLIKEITSAAGSHLLVQQTDENGNPLYHENGNPIYEPFTVEYDYDATLPYEYQLVELDQVEDTITSYSGMGVYSLNQNDWLRTVYEAT